MKNSALVYRLTLLNGKLDKVVELKDPRQEDESTLGKVGTGAAVAAGAGALGYGALSYARGRKWQKDVTGSAGATLADRLSALRTGHQMNSIAVRGALRGAKANTSAFVAGAKERAGQAVSATQAAPAAARKSVASGVSPGADKLQLLLKRK